MDQRDGTKRDCSYWFTTNTLDLYVRIPTALLYNIEFKLLRTHSSGTLAMEPFPCCGKVQTLRDVSNKVLVPDSEHNSSGLHHRQI